VDVPIAIPPLLVGFDVETTGLDSAIDEPISYGFAVFVDGRLVRTEEYFVVPSVQIHPAAERVHGISYEHLRKMARDGVAWSAPVGATRAARILLSAYRNGAVFVGANPSFDFGMTNAALRRFHGSSLAEFGIDLERASIVDIVKVDRSLDHDFVARPRRGLTHLCAYYGVTSGGHHAAQDSRAAVEVLLAQIAFAAARSCATSIDSHDLGATQHILDRSMTTASAGW
jgi:DNA polymerase III subunit epsilon